MIRACEIAASSHRSIVWMHMQANFALKATMVRRRALKVAERP
jgi:hypothetical protein